MKWFRSPFEPASADDRRVYGVMFATADFVGLALAIYFSVYDTSSQRFTLATITGATGLLSIVMATRLFTNSHTKDGTLVSPWVTLAVGVIFILVGLANGLSTATWMLPSGIAAAIFAVRHLRRRPPSSVRPPTDGA